MTEVGRTEAAWEADGRPGRLDTYRWGYLAGLRVSRSEAHEMLMACAHKFNAQSIRYPAGLSELLVSLLPAPTESKP